MGTAPICELIVAGADPGGDIFSLLTAIGANFRECLLDEVTAPGNRANNQAQALILSEEHLVSASKLAASRSESFRDILSNYRSVLIFPFSATPEGLRVLSDLTHTRVHKLNAAAGEYAVLDVRQLCGPFSGLQFGPTNLACDHPLMTDGGNNETFIIKVGGGGLFVRFKLGGSELFVNSCSQIFDVSAEYTRNLQAVECFSRLVPLMIFLRHSNVPSPRVTRSWANWIIDDPNLAPRYGFIKMQELADCVRRFGAALTIAFIPWNFRRTSGGVVNLFRSESSHLSICFHGCDHTGSEFVTTTDSEALQLSELAGSRMREFESRTSLHCENVMVFPQGRFSHKAMCGLRRSQFVGAVNTELVDSQTGKGVKGGELLQPAITSYGGFPLFLRRRAEDPLANFALDLFLGKPCLIVTHHQYFISGMQSLAEKVESLNKLDTSMRWMKLEKGILSTYTVRDNGDHSTDIRLFCTTTNLHMDTPSGKISASKSEPVEAQEIQVLWNGEKIDSSLQNGDVQIMVNRQIIRDVRIEVIHILPIQNQMPKHTFKLELKIAVRRYLSEFRDNYVDRSPRIKAAIVSARKLISRHS